MHEFELLHEYEQEELVFDKGIFLGNYVEGNDICDVYQLRDFYVKFSYLINVQGDAVVTAFEDPYDIPFFNDIDISSL